MINHKGLYKHRFGETRVFYFAGEFLKNGRKLIIYYPDEKMEITDDSPIFFSSELIKDSGKYINELEKKASSSIEMSKDVKKLLKKQKSNNKLSKPKCTELRPRDIEYPDEGPVYR